MSAKLLCAQLRRETAKQQKNLHLQSLKQNSHRVKRHGFTGICVGRYSQQTSN